MTLKYQVFDGQAWSGLHDGTGSSLFKIQVLAQPDTPEAKTDPLSVLIYEQDEDFGVAASPDNQGRPLTEYALRVAHFGAVQSGTPDSTVIYFDNNLLSIFGGRIEIFNSDTALWGLPGSQNHLGEDHVTGSAAGQFTVGQLRDGQVRLRFDEAHDPNTAFVYAEPLLWGFADATFDQIADIRADHITVLTQKHFGQISHADKQHDEHDLTITVTLARDAGDGTIQVWDGSVWATPADSDETTDGHQASFTVEQLEDGFVRYVHGGGEGGNQSLAWVVTDGDGTVSQTGTLKTAVTAVNDRPTSDDVIRTVDEDGTQSFTKTEIPFADVDARPEDDELHSVKIMSMNYGAGFGGTLKVNDRILGPGDFITADEIDSLTFTPDANQWDSVTVTIPAGQQWVRYDGSQWIGYSQTAYTVLNGDGTTDTEVTLSWSDLQRVVSPPAWSATDDPDAVTTLTLENMDQYLADPDDPNAVIDEAWFDAKSGGEDTRTVKVSVKGDKVVYINTLLNEKTGQRAWVTLSDVVADFYRPPASAGLQTLISKDVIQKGNVRIANSIKILTLDELKDTGNWNDVVFTFINPDDDSRQDYDPKFLTRDKISIDTLADFDVTKGTYRGQMFDLTRFNEAEVQADIGRDLTLAQLQAKTSGVSASYKNTAFDLDDFTVDLLTRIVKLAELQALTSGVSASYKNTAFDLDDFTEALLTRIVKQADLAPMGTYMGQDFTVADFMKTDVNKVVTLAKLESRLSVENGKYKGTSFDLDGYKRVDVGRVVTLKVLKKKDVADGTYKGTNFKLETWEDYKYDPGDVVALAQLEEATGFLLSYKGQNETTFAPLKHLNMKADLAWVLENDGARLKNIFHQGTKIKLTDEIKTDFNALATTTLTLADLQQGTVNTENPMVLDAPELGGHGLTGVDVDTEDGETLWVTYDGDMGHLNLLALKQIQSQWDGDVSDLAPEFQADQLKFHFIWNGVRQTVTFADLQANKVTRLPGDVEVSFATPFKDVTKKVTLSTLTTTDADMQTDRLPDNFLKLARVEFDTLLGGYAGKLSAVLDGEVTWLPADFLDKAVVKYTTVLGDQRPLLKAISDGTVTWLPADFEQEAVVEYTSLLGPQKVRLIEILNKEVKWLPADFLTEARVKYTSLLGEQRVILGEVLDGTATWLPADFADEAVVKYPTLLGEKRASLADILNGDVGWLPDDFRSQAEVTFTTILGQSRTVKLGDILDGTVDWLPEDFNEKVKVSLDYFAASRETVTFQDVLDGDTPLVKYALLYWNSVISFQQFDGVLPSLTTPLIVDQGRVRWDPAATQPGADVPLPFGLVTVPDGAVFEVWSQADGWTTVTTDAHPDRPGQQVHVDLNLIQAGRATMRFVMEDGQVYAPFSSRPGSDHLLTAKEGTRDRAGDDDLAFVTVKVRVFDGTELSSVERDIRVHVKAVNDAPVAVQPEYDEAFDTLTLSGGTGTDKASVDLLGVNITASSPGEWGNFVVIRMVYDETVTGISAAYHLTFTENVITLTFGKGLFRFSDIEAALQEAAITVHIGHQRFETTTNLLSSDTIRVSLAPEDLAGKIVTSLNDIDNNPVTSQITAPATISTDDIPVDVGTDRYIILKSDGTFEAVTPEEQQALTANDYAIVAVLNERGIFRPLKTEGTKLFFALNSDTLDVNYDYDHNAPVPFYADASGLSSVLKINEDGEFHFADALTGRGDANRLAKYEAFFGFDDVDKTTQGASEDWSLAAIRFTDLPKGGKLVLRPHDQVWYDASADSSAILRQWDGAGPPDTDLSDPGFADRRVRRDRDDGDVDVESGKSYSLDQLDQLVFVAAPDFHGTVTLKYQVFDGQAWSGLHDGTGSSLFKIHVLAQPDVPAPSTKPLSVLIYEQDEDFGVAASADNRGLIIRAGR